MSDYLVVEATTGRIVQSVSTPFPEVIALEQGQALIPGTADPAQHYVGDDGLMPYPERPGAWAVFDYAAGVWIDPRSVADLDAALKAARAAAIAEVNRTSGDIRARFITVIPGQEMLYLQKEAEAGAWLAAEAPALADYPLIAAEIGITAPDADQVAQVYVNMAAILRQTAAQLETLRLGTIATLEGASDTDAIDAALSQFLTAVTP